MVKLIWKLEIGWLDSIKNFSHLDASYKIKSTIFWHSCTVQGVNSQKLVYLVVGSALNELLQILGEQS